MNYYQQYLQQHKEKMFPPEYLCEKLIQSKNFIEQNFALPIFLQEIVAGAYISKYHFIRLFRKNMNDCNKPALILVCRQLVWDLLPLRYLKIPVVIIFKLCRFKILKDSHWNS
jgi:hypothetical protein